VASIFFGDDDGHLVGVYLSMENTCETSRWAKDYCVTVTYAVDGSNTGDSVGDAIFRLVCLSRCIRWRRRR
jgi:hypothetical protein